jgi:hypothetical protein
MTGSYLVALLVACCAAFAGCSTTQRSLEAVGARADAAATPPASAADTARAGDERIQHLGFRADLTLRPAITSLSSGPAGAVVSFTTLPGKSYRLEAQDVLGGGWQFVGGAQAGDGTVRQLADPAPTEPTRFYRVRVP